MPEHDQDSISHPLQDRLDLFARRWSLRILPLFESRSINAVAPVVQEGGGEVVLKVHADVDEGRRETEALDAFDGKGAVRLLDADREQGVLLLERLRPGKDLTSIRDDAEAMAIAADVIHRLRTPAPDAHSLPTVEEWGEGFAQLRARFNGGFGPFPRRAVEMGESLFRDLISSMDETLLLHGDLHHHNILSSTRDGWLAIDPKGVIGEAACETGALLRNPLPGLLNLPWPARVLARRIAQLSDELRLDRERVACWGVTQAVLAAWWSHEDGDEEMRQWFIACAELMGER